MRRKLPMLAEHSLATVLSARIEVATTFENKLQKQALDNHTPISCHAGCSNCCYHPVHISAMEGVLLYRKLVSHGRWTPSFRAKVQEHASKTKDLPYEVWFLSLLPCPLLDTEKNRCIAYDARPFACRVTFSTGDPHFCHPHRINDSHIANKHEVTEEFHARVNRAIKRHGITMIIMPLSIGLLIAERIENGEFDLEAADVAVLNEYLLP